MKPDLLLIAGLLLFAPDAMAQVIINQAALDQLAGIAPPVIMAPGAIRRAPPKASYRNPVSRRLHNTPRFVSLHPAAKPAPPSPPEVAAAKPAVTPVVAKPAPPPSAVIDFAAGAADLPGTGAATLKPFCTHANALIIIEAYAAADPGDPSGADRLSMSRAFAIRDALSACGIPSGNIIARANGAAKTKNPNAAEVTASP